MDAPDPLDPLARPRTTPEALAETAGSLLEHPVIKAVLESVGGFVMVLNDRRQVLAVNPDILRALGVEASEALLALRPGEVLQCTHAGEGPDGCNTSRACTHCGAFLTMIAAQRTGQTADGECHLTRCHQGRQEALEFKVRATPIEIHGHHLLVLVLQDISDLKRRSALEQTFFHDLKNTLQGLQGWSEILHVKYAQADQIAQHILDLSQHLTREVASQELLGLAERRELFIRCEDVAVEELLAEVQDHFKWHPCARDRHLHCQHPHGAVVHSDPQILLRVLVNMVKNAFEAVPAGSTIRLWFDQAEDGPTFHVQNPGYMPEWVELQVFQRSFSTKEGRGRGLGTYGMKLFGETYLGGRVGYRQSLEAGIEFYIKLNKIT